MKLPRLSPRKSLTGFTDKVAIVTGSSHGIGKEIALQLLQNGSKVVLNGRNDEVLRKTQDEFISKGYRPEKFTGDLSKYDVCEELIKFTCEKFGRLDFLINNAGQGFRGMFEQTKPWVIDTIISSNLLSSVFTTRSALNEIKKTGGSIIFISSLAGIRGLPLNSAYCIAKMGLTAFAQSLRTEMRKTNVHIGIIMVGFTDYDDQKRILTSDGTKIPISRKSDQTREQVACRVLNAIRKRKFLVVLTFLGKIAYLIEKLAPALNDFVVQRSKQTVALNH